MCERLAPDQLLTLSCRETLKFESHARDAKPLVFWHRQGNTPVAKFYGQLLCDGFTQGRLASARGAMEQDRAVEGDQVGVDPFLPKMQGCAGILKQPLLDALLDIKHYHEGLMYTSPR